MAIPFYANIDLNKNELQNARIQNLASDPSSPVEGQIYSNTTDHYLYHHNGTVFVNLRNAALLNSQAASYYLSRTNHTDTQLYSTIITSNTDKLLGRDTAAGGAVEEIGVSGGLEFTGSSGIQRSALTGDVTASAGSNTTAIAAGVIVDADVNASAAIAASKLAFTPADTIAATTVQNAIVEALTDARAYADTLSSGFDYKSSVRVATTANITISTALNNGDSIDGVTLATGDRVLVKDQSSGAENGIYVVAASPGRSTDADTSAEVTGGLTVWVNEGTANADTQWTLSTNDAITLDTTALVFVQTNALGQITAGAALTKSGNTLDVAVDGSTIEVSSDALRVKALGITDAHVAAANKDGASGTASMRTLGTGAAQAAAGDHTHSIYMQKYSVTLTGGATSEVVTHSLNSRAVIVDVSLVGSPYTQVQAEVEKTSVNTVTIKMAATIAAATYLVTVIG